MYNVNVLRLGYLKTDSLFISFVVSRLTHETYCHGTQEANKQIKINAN